MNELEKQWQAIDRAIGYVKGFMPAIWAMSTADDREVVAAESIAELEQVVDDLMVATARVRELSVAEATPTAMGSWTPDDGVER